MPNATAQDWRTLPAGRELDALVAERVFGLRIERSPSGALFEVPVGADFAEWHAGWLHDVRSVRHMGRGGVLLDYSKDVSEAWRVVEKLHALVFVSGSSAGTPDPWPHANYLTLSCLGLGAHKAGWAAAFTCVAFDEETREWFENPEQYGGAFGETPALAICRAALSALEVA
jgi:hypothetical protein